MCIDNKWNGNSAVYGNASNKIDTAGSTLHEFSMDQNELNSHFDNWKQTN